MDDERWVWCCSKCGREGPYSGSDSKYPRGWKFNLTHGLVCSKCAKHYKIKTSDVEKEKVKNKIIRKNLWDVL